MSLRHIIICALAAMSAVSAGAAASAASARLDIISSGDRIFSIMEADVSAITYGEANADGTYSFVTITATDGSTVTFEMSRVARIAYEPATGYEPFAISRVIGEHTSMGMLDCINNEAIIEADVFGDGIRMFLLSQGSWVRVLAPESFAKEMKQEIEKMAAQYQNISI